MDGVGAFDHIRRAQFLKKLYHEPHLRELLPVVRALYGTPSHFVWRDNESKEKIIEQGEDGEQGDPLMPALYALAQHDALAEAAGRLGQDEWLFAFLDDIYVVTTRDRATHSYHVVAECVERRAGVRTHLGKLQAWSAGVGEAPQGLDGVRADGSPVWTANAPAAECGVVCLGTPIGTADYVSKHGEERVAKEKRLLTEIGLMEDVQEAWALLLHCAVPRANHSIRTIPPSLLAPYAKAQNDAIWSTFCSVIGGGVDSQGAENDGLARQIAAPPGA